MSEKFRNLPKVDRLADDPLLVDWPRPVRIGAARQALETARQALLAGLDPPLQHLARDAQRRARVLAHGRMVGVINATGVVVHTNLGRAPWSASAVAAVQRVARYCDLEMDLATGARGGRTSGVRAQLEHLTGAPGALVVNNNAAAVLLVLTALAAGREVVVSRGELVEIGGSFRVPDVISSGGARLVEVGTTNRTRIADYEKVIGPATAVLLKVHPSNFRVTGFTEAPTRAELVALGRERNVMVVEDVGSGALQDSTEEPSIRAIVGAGLDLVCFSGDKLLGGPQAGLIVGRTDLVEQLRRHPLYRAMRVDKVILAALEATLGDHILGRGTPVTTMLSEPHAAVVARADALAAQMRSGGVSGDVVMTGALAGGGSWPGQELPSAAVRVSIEDPERAAAALRTGEPAIVCRVQENALLFDARTLTVEELAPVARRVAELLGAG